MDEQERLRLFRLRFWAKVQRGTAAECWQWTGGKQTGGYGRLMHNYKTVLAHWFAYEDTVGPIPAGLQIDHLCRNRGCVNPAHLEPVTLAEKIRRGETGKARGAVMSAKTRCPAGHPYDAENTVVNSRGRRECRICMRLHSRDSQRRRRAAEKKRDAAA